MLTLLFNSAYVSELGLTPLGGTVSMPVGVEVSVPSGLVAVYTLDGSLPTADSAQYTGQPIIISQTTTVRVAALDAGVIVDSVEALYKNDAEAGMTGSIMADELFVRGACPGPFMRA